MMREAVCGHGLTGYSGLPCESWCEAQDVPRCASWEMPDMPLADDYDNERLGV